MPWWSGSIRWCAREELLHDISHELRSPLVRLQLATGLARQLDKMIGELLTLSRAGHESMPDEQYFDLIGLVQAVVTDVRYEAQISDVKVDLLVDESVDYTVRGNAELIRRGIENVLHNALRFSLPGQHIQVRLKAEQQLLAIRVRDQGPGVVVEKLSSIFDPLVRVNSPLLGKGYGLGLAIVRKVVLAYHGEVNEVNRPEGGLELTLGCRAGSRRIRSESLLRFCSCAGDMIHLHDSVRQSTDKQKWHPMGCHFNS